MNKRERTKPTTSFWIYLAIAAFLLVAALVGSKPAAAGEALGIVTIVFFIYWVVAGERDSARPCPRCGQKVPVGQLDCTHCGFDFRTIGAPSGPGSPST